MKSKLTIEVDFDGQNTPCIRILAAYTDDVRDKLLKDFLERLGGESQWCTIGCVGVTSIDLQTSASEWVIKPVHPHEIQEEAQRMRAFLVEPPSNHVKNPESISS